MTKQEILSKQLTNINYEHAGIYVIYNLATDSMYIGQSKNIYLRFVKHRARLKKGSHVNKKLQNLYDLYGKDGFLFFCIELVTDVNKLCEREKYYIEAAGRDNLLNIHQASEVSLERHKNISASLTGRKLSEEHVKKMSEVQTSKWLDPGYREQMSKAHLGKTLSPEQKEKIGNSLRGKTQTEEARKNNSLAKKGRPLSEEHKKALSLAKKGKRSSRASISDDLARQIYLEKKKTSKTCLEIAKENGVSLDIVKHITNPNSKSWTHIRT